ncbi:MULTISPECIES: hypothetical protein [unclassified Tatumella]|uniref:hypothetical protein n=1 Tax=unclassified Tatumella TaxID=2649542 RepID=UPI001BAFD507|nr:MULTISPECIES: hypothetical protein [unclassified Tatumella]MBS0877965.1 hypothetical protein [Tatumella sp. JGM82]MBS0891312.1 hypothetical protein [Tatumella sp. JGM94]MBS0902691.1 hypothetical protein [Tatumella sp. JGM100]
MRDYGKVHTSFWISDGMRRVSDDARLLALYLLTGQHTNMIGCFRLPDGYVSEDLAWAPERVSKGFDELSNNGFATRDSVSKWVLIHNFLSWNPIENPNQGISAMRLFDQIPGNSRVKPELARILSVSVAHIGTEKLKGSERVLQPFLSQEQEQEQEQEQKNTLGHGSAIPPDDDETDSETRGSKKKTYPEDFERAWAIYPKRAGGNSKADAVKAWNARITAGEPPEKLIAGVKRYAVYVTAAGKLGTEFVKQAATFFGPSKHYEESWESSVQPGMRAMNMIPQPDIEIPTGFRG